MIALAVLWLLSLGAVWVVAHRFGSEHWRAVGWLERYEADIAADRKRRDRAGRWKTLKN